MNNIKLPADDNSCGWFEILSPEYQQHMSEPNPISGVEKTDWLVIGGGFVGMSATHRLAELNPEQRIVLVDAQKIGHGTSGRNSGFVIDLPHKSDLVGDDIERKRKVIELNRAAIQYLEDKIMRHGIECQWSHAGKLQGAVSERGVKFLEHFQRLLKELGEPHEMLDQASLRKVVGTQYYQQALYTPGCPLMQPAALIRGLLAHVPDNVSVWEETPILNLERRNGTWVAQTANGQVHAKNVILGTNIYTEQFGHMTSRMLPIMTFASMTRPLTDAEFAAYGGTADWGLTPADHAGTTLRMTQDRRLMVRNQYRFVPNYNSDLATREKIHVMHRESLEARYPMLKAVTFEHTWGGVLSLSSNSQAFFGELEPGLFSSCCHNGVGVARGTISGKLLAEMASGGDSKLQQNMQAVSGMPARLPPEPFLGIGVRARMAFAKWQSRSEV